MESLKLISRPKLGPINHYGVLVGEVCFELTPDGFKKCNLRQFSQGFPVKIEKEVPCTPAVLSRMKNFTPGKFKYHLTNFNCEHFARYLVEGEARSEQVRVAFALASLALIIVLSK